MSANAGEAGWTAERTPLLVVISGPSGVGKDSVVQRLKERGYPFHFVVTATSRAPRPGEVHGRDYFFVSEAEFRQMIQDEALLEYALVYGQYKGIPKAQVRTALASGQDVVMRLDVQGAATVRRIVPEAVQIFLTVPSEDELLQRLRARHTETEAELQRRLEMVKAEFCCLKDFDYAVVNQSGQLERAVDQIVAIMEAEHCRVNPRRVQL